MKILDRYVILSFIKNYCISFMVLVGMYVVLDMVFNFNNMVVFQPNAGAFATLFDTLRDMGDYYFYQCFLFFVNLSGIIPVVAAAFTLMRLSRFNELTAMLAAGVPLLRVAAPIVIAGLLLNALLVVDQELLIPRMIPKLVRDHEEVHAVSATHFPINSMQDLNNGLLRASRYFHHPPDAADDAPPMMQVVDITERREKNMIINEHAVKVLEPYAKLSADKANWNPKTGAWDLVNGVRITGIGADDKTLRKSFATEYRGGVTPEEINLYRSGNYVELLSTERINQLLDRPKSYGALNLLRVKHSRVTQPIMNVILLLLAIPCVVSREPGSIKTGATRCLVLMALAMGSVFITAQLAGHPMPNIAPDYWAAGMAWLPIFIFGPLSIYLMEQIKT